jgi:hypothetical protein
MLKKLFSVLFVVCALLFAVTGTVDAAPHVKASQMGLGGVFIGTRMQDVVATYGQPRLIDTWMDGRGGRTQYPARTYQYGNSVIFDTWQGPTGVEVVVYIEVTADNGWATPDGVHVGQTFADMHRALGRYEYMDVDEKLKKKGQPAAFICYEAADRSMMSMLFYSEDNGSSDLSTYTIRKIVVAQGH